MHVILFVNISGVNLVESTSIIRLNGSTESCEVKPFYLQRNVVQPLWTVTPLDGHLPLTVKVHLQCAKANVKANVFLNFILSLLSVNISSTIKQAAGLMASRL